MEFHNPAGEKEVLEEFLRISPDRKIPVIVEEDRSTSGLRHLKAALIRPVQAETGFERKPDMFVRSLLESASSFWSRMQDRIAVLKRSQDPSRSLP